LSVLALHLVASETGVDLVCPRIDSTCDVADLVKAILAEKLGHTQAATTVVAEDQEMSILGELRKFGGNFSHRDEFGSGDGADFRFKRLTHVDEGDAPGMIS